MDLDEADTAVLSEEQWACIESPAGKRLYSDKAPGKSNTPSPPAVTSAPTAES
jgi:hypothetical protein